MKLILLLLFPVLLTSCSVNHPPRVKYHLDENREVLSNKEFQEKWRNKDNNLSRWDYVSKDSSRVATLFRPVYKKYELNYPAFRKKLEEMTNQKFPENQIFVLEYTFVDDMCADDSSNNWNKLKVRSRKRFTDVNKEKIEENEQLIVLNFFEEGILLENSEDSEEEYFFMDQGNFLRNLLFTSPTLCGSFAVIKPSGEALSRNGEYNALSMASHLKEENWSLFFGSN